MRPASLAALLTLAALAAPASAHGGHSWPPSYHSAHVSEFFWAPQEPARGMDVQAVLTLANGSGIDPVFLRVCRVEAYACRAPIEMARSGGTSDRPQFTTTIPWDGRFYKGVRQVGIAVILTLPNGSREESPVVSWPAPPPELPEGAGNYYLFVLPPEADAPGAPAALLLVAVAAAIGRARRRP